MRALGGALPRILQKYSLIVAMSLSIVQSADACTCAVEGSPKTEFHWASAVFVGTVEGYDVQSEVASVRVDRVFKGSLEVGEAVTVASPMSEEACGYGAALVAASTHVFWASDSWQQPAQFAVDYCGWTATLADSSCLVSVLQRRQRWWTNPMSRIRILRWLRISLPSCPHPRFGD